MKNLILVVCAAVAMVSCRGGKSESAEGNLDTVPMMILQIQKTSRLYTTECHLRKIITHNDAKTIKGSLLDRSFQLDLPLSNRKVAIPMDATVKAYIDFKDFSEKNVRKDGDKIEIILPDPKLVLTGTKIAHDEVKEYVALARSRFTDEELSALEKQGRAAIIKDISSLDIITVAKENAAKTLIPLIRQMGYRQDDITITFKKRFTASEIETLIDKSTIEHEK